MNAIHRTKKEWMKEQIDRMETQEHNQVFRIIQRHTDQYTKTQTGVLVSTDNLNDECLQEIEKYLYFCIDQKKRMEDDLKTRKTYERLIQ